MTLIRFPTPDDFLNWNWSDEGEAGETGGFLLDERDG